MPKLFVVRSVFSLLEAFAFVCYLPISHERKREIFLLNFGIFFFRLKCHLKLYI